MIADAAEATLTMPGVNLLDGEVLALRRSRAMDDDLVNLSHGLCIYTGKMYDAISKMVQYATPECPVYFQLFLDKNFLLGQNKEEFRKMVANLNNELKDTNVYMLFAYIEGTDEYPYRSNIKLNASEHFWTISWAADNAKSWIDKIPLPKRHAKIYNEKYIEENQADYLMIDFIEIGKSFYKRM